MDSLFNYLCTKKIYNNTDTEHFKFFLKAKSMFPQKTLIIARV